MSPPLLKPTPPTAALTNQPPALMLQLRHATAGIHTATEELPLMRQVLAPTATLQAYVRYLIALYQVYLTVEPLLYAVCSRITLTQLAIYPKLPALQQDLLALGQHGAWLPLAGWSSRMRELVTDEATALGGLYVLEGATLGGRVIARQLKRQWSTSPDPLPVAFLEFRGDSAIAAGWQQFGAGLDQIARQSAHPHEMSAAVVSGAQRVFQALHAALGETAAH
ncbi:biliverdin-producing heme oxygenase [Rhodoferax sp. 4810]|uniref:Biliverdin-producing heme oxygenase n=1 Tax=Thiospirillum jenense TaxID=1653858 RepID=A0A839H2E3_9GAMM|nr:biliverdin-producing heme oxygenase [Thiospirillum jenense]MBB1073166.1 biliverdin-producing heme oxygenase [Rhodoferax jenense]MBB1124673.1 biliverdin-producing heme oxygenase [Thiospirillum jenense]